MTSLLFTDNDWDFETLKRVYDAIEEIGITDLGLDLYPNQIEIISSEQMLDAYSSHGMPLMYPHWSFGKIFAREHTLYQKGYTALAYEIVINSNPCINFLMEENTMTMQTLVMAHAGLGHNHFFKNNYLFQQWTDAEAILDYLNFARSYIARCEEEYGQDAVEAIVDAAHALMDQGVFRYARPPRLSDEERLEKIRRRLAHDRETFNDLWRTLPQQMPEEAEPDHGTDGTSLSDLAAEDRQKMQLPEENLLYFLEKHSPVLRPWQREILRIVRNVAQYFYPMKQTKMMNEGCATFVHHYVLSALYDQGRLSEGSMLEVLHSHAQVVFQPGFDDPRYRGFNPYALGFAMMSDIRRMCEDPTDEDRHWFPDFAGRGDWRGVLRHAWANFRDESFILQYLSPHLMRELRLFQLSDSDGAPYYEVAAIHDERGYTEVRAALAAMYDIGRLEPNIQVVEANLRGDRVLRLEHTRHKGVPLTQKGLDQTMAMLRRLWGHGVELKAVDAI